MRKWQKEEKKNFICLPPLNPYLHSVFLIFLENFSVHISLTFPLPCSFYSFCFILFLFFCCHIFPVTRSVVAFVAPVHFLILFYFLSSSSSSSSNSFQRLPLFFFSFFCHLSLFWYKMGILSSSWLMMCCWSIIFSWWKHIECQKYKYT